MWPYVSRLQDPIALYCPLKSPVQPYIAIQRAEVCICDTSLSGSYEPPGSQPIFMEAQQSVKRPFKRLDDACYAQNLIVVNFSIFSENVGVKKLGFIAFKKVPDRYRKLREA